MYFFRQCMHHVGWSCYIGSHPVWLSWVETWASLSTIMTWFKRMFAEKYLRSCKAQGQILHVCVWTRIQNKPESIALAQFLILSSWLQLWLLLCFMSSNQSQLLLSKQRWGLAPRKLAPTCQWPQFYPNRVTLCTWKLKKISHHCQILWVFWVHTPGAFLEHVAGLLRFIILFVFRFTLFWTGVMVKIPNTDLSKVWSGGQSRDKVRFYMAHTF